MLTPGAHIGPLDADSVGLLVSAASDFALVIDRDGHIDDVSVRQGSLTTDVADKWRGRAWRDTVTIESQPKIDDLLRDASTGEPPRWRHVNHLHPDAGDIPVAYTTVSLGEDGKSVAIGRDMRPLANMQQQLVSAQQSMERDYARLRQHERRYRLLFHMAGDALIVVDATSRVVIEANNAAAGILSRNGPDLSGQSFPLGLEEESARRMTALLDAVSLAGRADDLPMRSASGEDLVGSITLFRQENRAYFLVRLQLSERSAAARSDDSPVLAVIEHAPDGFVITDPAGQIVTANPAFLQLAELATADQAVGASLGRWLGRPGVDLKVLLSNLREHGAVRHFGTVIAGEFGGETQVEVAAVSVTSSQPPCLGFSIREIQLRPRAEVTADTQLPQSVEQMAELVGRYSLKDIVRQTTDHIERLCIESALNLTGDNRASAAEMLGLSRQSLYVKLRRFSVGENADDSRP